jgi:hypothetical protein
VEQRLRESGAVYAYARAFEGIGSITVFLQGVHYPGLLILKKLDSILARLTCAIYQSGSDRQCLGSQGQAADLRPH